MISAIAIWNYCWEGEELPGWIHEFADHGFEGFCTIEIAPTFHGRTPQESKEDAMQSPEHWRSLMTAEEPMR
ncbi:hypothetical protein ACFLSJ_02215 [Verrucomicrobiota bacterium]